MMSSRWGRDSREKSERRAWRAMQNGASEFQEKS